jgi:proteasome accessory factor C
MTPRSNKRSGTRGAAKQTAQKFDDAAAQLNRLNINIALLADGEEHALEDLAKAMGTDVALVMRDLNTLLTRYDDGPGGFIEGVRIALTATTAQLDSTLFRRPMGLTAEEMGTLELGLAVLGRELPAEEAGIVKRARKRLRNMEMATARSTTPVRFIESHAARLTESPTEASCLEALRSAVSAKQKIVMTYRSARQPAGADRVVHPHNIAYLRGKWYLVAWCEQAGAMRVFRVDRAIGVTPLPEPAELRDDVHVEALVAALVSTDDAREKLVVRYSPAVARWISEQEGVPLLADGSVVVEYPLLDAGWGVRKVALYGTHAQVISPSHIRYSMTRMLNAITA